MNRSDGHHVTYLKSVYLKNYFYLNEIQLDNLEDRKEIYIVGENGDGKTLFLQAVVLALKGNEDVGVVNDFIKEQKDQIFIEATDSNNQTYCFVSGKRQESGFENVTAYGVNRYLNGSDRKDEFGYLTLFDSSRCLGNPVRWLQYLDYKQAVGEKDRISPELAKEMLRDVLDANVEIKITPDGVVFCERDSELEFGQLSDGYKGVIIWVCDLMERFSKNQPHVRELGDFRGIVLIDEIDLHLHPKWKYQIVRKLRTWFPKIQFILTTHSPTVILGSSGDAVFYKAYKESGIVRMSKPLKNVRNLMANTVMTSPLFGLEQAVLNRR